MLVGTVTHSMRWVSNCKRCFFCMISCTVKCMSSLKELIFLTPTTLIDWIALLEGSLQKVDRLKKTQHVKQK